MRDEAEAASRAVVVDHGPGRNSRRTPPPPHLAEIQRAVVGGAQIRLAYVARDGAGTERVVHPLGLAARGSTWYLLADTAAGMRTFRVDRVTQVVPTGEPAVRPAGFDLEEAWATASEGMRRHWRSVEVQARVRSDGVELLQQVFGTRLRTGPPDADGRVEVVLVGPAEAALVGELSGFGALVEVIGPPSARARAEAVAAELAGVYLGRS
jgi:predicted DNA-binding transcriptional regulator YafY